MRILIILFLFLKAGFEVSASEPAFLFQNTSLILTENTAIINDDSLILPEKISDSISLELYKTSEKNNLSGNPFSLTLRKKLNLNENKRITAAMLAVLLGHFGVHRIYLGTKPIVPVAYVLTLGGGIILPLIDAVLILTTKDLSRFENNNRFFMWAD